MEMYGAMGVAWLESGRLPRIICLPGNMGRKAIPPILTGGMGWWLMDAFGNRYWRGTEDKRPIPLDGMIMAPSLWHQQQDPGVELRAITDGIVIGSSTSHHPVLGHWIEVRTSDGWRWSLTHMKGPSIFGAGANVVKSVDILGFVGTSPVSERANVVVRCWAPHQIPDGQLATSTLTDMDPRPPSTDPLTLLTTPLTSDLWRAVRKRWLFTRPETEEMDVEDIEDDDITTPPVDVSGDNSGTGNFGFPSSIIVSGELNFRIKEE